MNRYLRTSAIVLALAVNSCAEHPTAPRTVLGTRPQSGQVTAVPMFGTGSALVGGVAAPPGLKACWSAEDNADDPINANNGANTGGYTTGPIGRAFEFTAINQGVTVPASASLDVGASSEGLTFAAWILTGGTQGFNITGGAGPIIEFKLGAHLWQYYLDGGSDGLLANLFDTQNRIAQVSNVVQQGVWYHVAVTYVRSTGIITLYRNGVSIATYTPPAGSAGFTPQTSTALSIGQRVSGSHSGASAFTFNGAIDEVQIYDRGLTADQINSLYTAAGTMCVKLDMVAQALGAKSGSPLADQPVEVQVTDVRGTRIPDATHAVTVSLVTITGTGTLSAEPPGALTVNADAGVAKFQNLVVTGPGTYKLKFSATSVGDATSDQFTVSQAASTVTVTCPLASQTYTGSLQTPCTAAATGVGIATPVDVTASLVYANNMDAGPATATATWAGDLNHTGSTSVGGGFTISAAPVTATAGSYSGVYDGTAQTVPACAVTGTYKGDLSCANSALTATDVQTGTVVTPIVSGTGLSNFTVTLVNGSINVSQATNVVAITSASPNTLPYLGTYTPTTSATWGTPQLSVAGVCTLLGGTVTMTSGTGTCTVTAAVTGTTNYAGGTATQMITAAPVVSFTWQGFFEPIDNVKVNSNQAGSTIPIKFNLGGNKGLNIFIDGYPATQQVFCSDFTTMMGTPLALVREKGPALIYDDGGKYQVDWKTDKAWASTCRILFVKLTDGSTHTAKFQFKK